MAISCPNCQVRLKTSRGAGRSKKCPKCGHVFTVPPAPAVLIALSAHPSAPRSLEQSLTRGRPAWPLFSVVLASLVAVLAFSLLGGGSPAEPAPEPNLDPVAPKAPVVENPQILALVAQPAPPPEKEADAAAKPVESPAAPMPPAEVAAAPAPVKAAAAVQVPEPKIDAPPRDPGLKIEVTEAEQRQINQALARGVGFLKASLINPRGDEDAAHAVGRIALAGLTLLECGVRADDAAVVRAAQSVRRSAPTLRDTYSLSLAIMFLDRLDHPGDRGFNRTFAARLIAGQNGRGGWTYDCPLLTTTEETTLLTMLENLPPLKNIVSDPKPLPDPLPRGGPLQNPLEPKGRRPLQNPLPTSPELPPLEPKNPEKKDRPRQGPDNESAPARPIAPMNGIALPARVLGPGAPPLPAVLRDVPALKLVPGQGVRLAEKKEGDDNSNTQFAIMGLWAARRHGVPMDRTLVLVERRFRSTQNADGSWGYHAWDHKQADSMTCTGLLGMALALGLDLELQGRKAGVAAADASVRKGFAYLSSTIGKTPGANLGFKGKGKDVGKGKKGGSLVGADARGDLYYLWSLERVAVIYSTPTIGAKNWYRWGAGVILAHQQADGSWRERYAGIPDTSFALLFLARANLIRGLPQLAREYPYLQRGRETGDIRGPRSFDSPGDHMTAG